MNQNLILRIVGVILCIEALCMIPPLLLSVFGGGPDQRAFRGELELNGLIVSAVGSEDAFYALYGWAPGPGLTYDDVPGPNSEWKIAAGATHVRVGSAIFGERAYG